MAHTFLSIGITVLTNMTNSVNSRQFGIHKALVLFFISVTFGIVVGPIGHALPSLSLYCIIILVRRDYSLFDINLFATHAITVLAILIFYPIIAIQIKYVWRNRYRRYIEYGL